MEQVFVFYPVRKLDADPLSQRLGINIFSFTTSVYHSFIPFYACYFSKRFVVRVSLAADQSSISLTRCGLSFLVTTIGQCPLRSAQLWTTAAACITSRPCPNGSRLRRSSFSSRKSSRRSVWGPPSCGNAQKRGRRSRRSRCVVSRASRTKCSRTAEERWVEKLSDRLLLRHGSLS